MSAAWGWEWECARHEPSQGGPGIELQQYSTPELCRQCHHDVPACTMLGGRGSSSQRVVGSAANDDVWDRPKRGWRCRVQCWA